VVGMGKADFIEWIKVGIHNFADSDIPMKTLDNHGRFGTSHGHSHFATVSEAQ